MRAGRAFGVSMTLGAVVLASCTGVSELPVTPWFKMVQHYRRFEIPHVWEPGKRDSTTYQLIGGRWEEIDWSVSGGWATPLAGDRVLYGSFGYRDIVVFSRDRSQAKALPGCRLALASPSGNRIGCIAEDSLTLIRITTFGADGTLLDTADYPAPEYDVFGPCSMYDLLFRQSDERPVPIPHCETAYLVFDRDHWTKIDGLASLSHPPRAVLDRLGVALPRASVE